MLSRVENDPSRCTGTQQNVWRFDTKKIGEPGLTALSLLLLAFCTVGLFWKLTLTKQYTWLDNPDITNQVLPWLQEQTRQWKSGNFPVWDHHLWGGYPLVGQSQPGVLFPLNWLLALTPLQNGHLRLSWLNWYFVLIHYLGAAFTFALCRDRGCSRLASIGAGILFGCGGFVGSNPWPQILNGAIVAPLVVLFVLRSIDGLRPMVNGAIAGCLLGVSVWSGHHQAPMFVGLGCALLFVAALAHRPHTYPALLRSGAAFGMLAALTALPQLWAAREFYMRALRWVALRTLSNSENAFPI